MVNGSMLSYCQISVSKKHLNDVKVCVEVLGVHEKWTNNNKRKN